ncbi:hypothetical protein Tco_1193948 [Tanacetum coccineum]
MGLMQRLCLQALRTQFKEFLASKGVNATDLLNQGWQQDFEDFTRCEPSAYRRELLENLDTLEAVIHKALFKKAGGYKSQIADNSSSSGTFTTHAVDAVIRPVNDHSAIVLLTQVQVHLSIPLKERLGVWLSKRLISIRLEFMAFNLMKIASNDVWDNNNSGLVLHLMTFDHLVQTSLTEAEDAVAREVHATHARIVSGPDPEPVQEDQTGSIEGFKYLEPVQEEKTRLDLNSVEITCCLLLDPNNTDPNPEHMDDEFSRSQPKVHEYLKLITDDVSRRKIQNVILVLYDKEKSKVIRSLMPPYRSVIDSNVKSSSECSLHRLSHLLSRPSLVIPTNHTVSYNNHKTIEQEMFEVQRRDHSSDFLASNLILVPTGLLINIEEQNLDDDALLEFLNGHTASRFSESKGTKVEDCNRIQLTPSGQQLALIADEDAMDKEVAVKVKDHKRKHDSDDEEDDDDDEGPSAGSHQGRMRSSNSSRSSKGIQTLTPGEQEAVT